MKKYYLLLLSCTFLFSQHFNVDISDTGESTLFIFQDTISSLEPGDEVGLFDQEGIVDSNGNIGEILIGTGVWDGSQLSVAAIASVDLSQFGGPILPGSINGHEMTLKVWKATEQIEYDVTYDIDTGSGTFNGLFTAISEIHFCEVPLGACDCNGNILDECGVCDGPGAIYECGCSNILDEACDCDENILDCNNECGGNAQIDQCGVCGGDNSSCTNGQVVLGFYDLDGSTLTNITYDNLSGEVCIENPIFSSITGNSLVVDISECITLPDTSGSIPIYIKNIESIAGFQFNLSGLNILNVTGGSADEAGFTVSTNNGLILGFSFSGSIIPPSGEFYGCLDVNACNFNQWANLDDGSCYYAEDGYDCDGNCINEDCNGDCNGNAAFDECGICGGDGASYWCEELNIYVCSEEDCYTDGGSTGGTTGGGSTGGDDGWEDDSGGTDGDDNDGGTLVDYSSDIQPIFNINCTSYCHSSPNHESGLDLTSYESLMNGGNSGYVVMPGYSDYSLLIQKLQGTAPGLQMPPELPLEESEIDLIATWIDEGANGPDGDDGGLGGGCEEDQILDCDQNCVDPSYLEDGNCNDGSDGLVNFNCAALYFDGDCYDNFENCSPDCPVGILEFGEINVNLDNETSVVSGSLEILMDCQFSVSDFDITLSNVLNDDTLPPIINDFNILNITGGSAIDSNFDVESNDNILVGSDTDDSSLPPGEQTLLLLEFETTGNKICFESSNITTSIGIQYQAVLDNCIPIAHYYEGWNWISLNQTFDDMSLDSVFSAIEDAPTYIKSQSEYADYYSDFGWFGTLENIDNLSMYKINMLNSDALALRGEYVNVDSTIFTLYEGWNWIGYSPDVSIDIENALLNIPDGFATYIKSQSEYADYYSDFGWFGTLETMHPLFGYLVSATNTTDFTFNDDINNYNRLIDNNKSNNSIFDINIHNFEFNGSITAELSDFGTSILNPEEYVLLAYNDNQCIGIGESKFFSLNNNTVFHLMVYGNNTSNMHFKAYHIPTSTYYNIKENIIFNPDIRLGDAINPIKLNLDRLNNSIMIKNPYPNPFNPTINIDFDLIQDTQLNIAIYNLNGQEIDILLDEYIYKGNHKVSWTAKNQSSGVYFMKIKLDNEQPIVKKIILIK